MSKYTFILSTGRTGTLFFARLFDTQQANVCAVHEPKPSYHLRIMSNAYSCGLLSERSLLSVFLSARSGIFKALGDKNYIEANNFIYGFI